MGSFGSHDPGRSTPGQCNLGREFQSLCKQRTDSGASPKSQHVIPNSEVLCIASEFRAGVVGDQMAARLTVLAHFFLLWVGECTPSENPRRAKRTAPLRKCGIRLLRDGSPVNPQIRAKHPAPGHWSHHLP
jgi:hypothetical protein